jgi:hypothetical protein
MLPVAHPASGSFVGVTFAGQALLFAVGERSSIRLVGEDVPHTDYMPPSQSAGPLSDKRRLGLSPIQAPILESRLNFLRLPEP